MTKHKTVTVSNKHYARLEKIARNEGRSVKNAAERIIDKEFGFLI